MCSSIIVSRLVTFFKQQAAHGDDERVKQHVRTSTVCSEALFMIDLGPKLKDYSRIMLASGRAKHWRLGTYTNAQKPRTARRYVDRLAGADECASSLMAA